MGMYVTFANFVIICNYTCLVGFLYGFVYFQTFNRNPWFGQPRMSSMIYCPETDARIPIYPTDLGNRHLRCAIATWRRVSTARKHHRRLRRIAIGFYRRRLLSRVWHQGWRALVLQRRTAELLAGYMAADRHRKSIAFGLWLWGVKPAFNTIYEPHDDEYAAHQVRTRRLPLGCKFMLRHWRATVVRIRAHRRASNIIRERRKQLVLVTCIRGWRRLQVTRSTGLARVLRRKKLVMQELRNGFKLTRYACVSLQIIQIPPVHHTNFLPMCTN